MITFAQLILPVSLLFTASAPDEGQRPDRTDRFAELDTDNSGTISVAEAEDTRLEQHFSKIDANDDGQIDRDEMKAAREARKGKRGSGGCDRNR